MLSPNIYQFITVFNACVTIILLIRLFLITKRIKKIGSHNNSEHLKLFKNQSSVIKEINSLFTNFRSIESEIKNIKNLINKKTISDKELQNKISKMSNELDELSKKIRVLNFKK
jgi:protein subunit release factor A